MRQPGEYPSFRRRCLARDCFKGGDRGSRIESSHKARITAAHGCTGYIRYPQRKLKAYLFKFLHVASKDLRSRFRCIALDLPGYGLSPAAPIRPANDAGQLRERLLLRSQAGRAEKEMPALLIFGDLDGLIKRGWLSRFERIFPRHRTIIMKGAHHFPQEYDPGGVATAIRVWWDEEIEQGDQMRKYHGGVI